MKRILFIFVLLMIPTLIGAQTYTLFTSENSDLPYNGLYDIGFDNYGNIWFTGEKGATGLANVSMLSQDLSTWTVYDAYSAELGLDETEDRVFYMAVDHYNNKWFCTHYGLSYLKGGGETGAMLIDDYTRSVFVDKKGIIYVSNRTTETIEVSEDGGETWSTWEMADIGMSDGRPEIYDIDYDPTGRLWICTYYGVFFRDLAGDWHAVADIEGAYTYGMALDLTGRAWVPDADTNDLYEIASDGTVTVHDSTTIEPLKYDIYDIASDCNGHIWCATNGGGLLEIRPDGSFETYTVASTNGQLPSDNLELVKIHCGALWVASFENGIVKIDGLIDTGEYQLFTSENSDLPYNGLYDIGFDNYGNIWFTGEKGATGLANVSILSQDLSTWTVNDASSAELGLDQTEDRVFHMAVDHYNNKWFCTHYGVSYLMEDGEAGAMMIDDYTRTVFVDKKGIIYISNRTTETIEVSEDGGETWSTWEMADIGMSDGRPEIYDIDYDPTGRLWICTYYGVFFRDLAGDWHAVADIEGAYTYGMALDLTGRAWVPDADTNDLYEIASDGTVTVHDSTTIEPLKYDIYDIASDCNGHIWCATNGGGLLEIKPDLSYETYTNASTSGQLPSDNLELVKINAGALWVATVENGVVRMPDILAATTGVATQDNKNIPTDFNLHSNYPNPFNPTTTITFDLTRQSDIKLKIFDLKGRLVKSLKSGTLSAGTYQVTWDGTDMYSRPVASGIYIYRLDVGQEFFSRKMLLIK